LTGDYQTDLLLRTNFRYPRAPGTYTGYPHLLLTRVTTDVKLAKSMLELLSERHKAAYYCLELYQLYQSDFTYSPSGNHVTALKWVS